MIFYRPMVEVLHSKWFTKWCWKLKLCKTSQLSVVFATFSVSIFFLLHFYYNLFFECVCVCVRHTVCFGEYFSVSRQLEFLEKIFRIIIRLAVQFYCLVFVPFFHTNEKWSSLASLEFIPPAQVPRISTNNPNKKKEKDECYLITSFCWIVWDCMCNPVGSPLFQISCINQV